SIDSTALLIRHVYYGDANLDKTVDTIDFNVLAVNFSQSGKVWFDGDFDYNGTVDTIDFNLLAANFAQALASPSIGALIPEPAAVVLGALIAPALLARR